MADTWPSLMIEEFCEGRHEDLPQPEGRLAREIATSQA